MPVFWDTVIAKFNAEDTRLMLERINTALTTGQEAVPLAWRNDTSGVSGTATPLNRLRCNELDRRRVKITNRSGSMTGESIWRFCAKPQGHWKVVDPDDSR